MMSVNLMIIILDVSQPHMFVVLVHQMLIVTYTETNSNANLELGIVWNVILVRSAQLLQIMNAILQIILVFNV